MSQEVILEKAVITEDGRAIVVRTPFKELPDWAKTAVNPMWNHPPMCECSMCWEVMECSG